MFPYACGASVGIRAVGLVPDWSLFLESNVLWKSFVRVTTMRGTTTNRCINSIDRCLDDGACGSTTATTDSKSTPCGGRGWFGGQWDRSTHSLSNRSQQRWHVAVESRRWILIKFQTWDTRIQGSHAAWRISHRIKRSICYKYYPGHHKKISSGLTTLNKFLYDRARM